MDKNVPKTIDEYISKYPEEVQERLQKLRATVLKAAPKAEQTIKYGMPTFMLNGNLVYFAVAMPGFIDASGDLMAQAVILMVTVTICEMFGLMVYAYGADALAQRFQSASFAKWFFRIAALTMAGSALFAVFATWTPPG